VGGPAAGWPRGKAPGLDGLTVEIFRVFSDVLASDYTGVLVESKVNGSLTAPLRFG